MYWYHECRFKMFSKRVNLSLENISEYLLWEK